MSSLRRSCSWRKEQAIPGRASGFPRELWRHIDAARHFVPDGRTIDQYRQDRFLGPAVILDVRREGVVPLTAAELKRERPEIQPGDMVFLYFGYADRFRKESFHLHPYLSNDAADFLVERRISILGVDTVTPDLPGRHRAEGFCWPVHTRLLPSDILVIENLGLGLKEILGRRVTVAAVPCRIEGRDGAPVVPLALLEEGEA